MSSVSYRHFTGTAAENYQRDFVPAIAEPVSRDLLRAANLREGERVLDVACGTGLISRLASERVGADGAVTGIDIAPDMLSLRYPMEVNLVGDAAETLRALLPMLTQKKESAWRRGSDGSFHVQPG